MKIESKNNIKEIKNFFSINTYQKLLALSKDSNDYNLTGYDPKGFWDNRSKKIPSSSLLNDLNNEFNTKMTKYGNFNEIVIIKFLDKKSITADGRYAVEPHYIKHPPKYWERLCIININDDYLGGEIVFPDHNISLKQEKNSAVCFDGNTTYQINPITYGEKYILTIFGK